MVNREKSAHILSRIKGCIMCGIVFEKGTQKEVMGLRRRKKQIMTAIICSAAAIAMITAALAYSSTTDEITNTFSIGNVRVALTETEYPGNDVSMVTPNKEIAKNPQINNVGINKAFVFLKVTVPMREVTVADAHGSCSEKAVQEIFYMKTNDNDVYKTENSFSERWTELEAYREEREETKTYVFGYKDALGALRATEPLFDKVQLKNITENEIDPDQLQKIEIEAYAIQSEHIPGIETENELTREELEEIYRLIES